MGRLDTLIIGRMRHDDAQAGLWVLMRFIQDALALGLGILEMLQERFGVRHVKIPAGIFLFGLFEDVTIGQWDWRLRVVERHVHYVIRTQDVDRQSFQPISQLTRNGPAVVATDLLEIRKLADFHPVAPDFPAKTPSTQRGTFPIILDKADIVHRCIDADGGQ